MRKRTLLLAMICTSLLACKKADRTSSRTTDKPDINVAVIAHGYDPSEVRASPNTPVRLVFKRTTDEGCGQQLVFPALNIRRDLPLNEPVAVDITMPSSGALAFTCGMGMYKGTIVVQ